MKWKEMKNKSKHKTLVRCKAFLSDQYSTIPGAVK